MEQLNKKLLEAAEEGNKDEVVKCLQEGANINCTGSNKNTPLHLAAANGHEETLHLLMKAGANVNAKGYLNKTPLHLAATDKYEEALDLLLKAGIADKGQGLRKKEPLLKAAKERIAQILMDAGAEVNDSSSGATVLHQASYYGYETIAGSLIEAGADINARSIKERSTPLHNAAHRQHDKIVQILVEAGSDINTKALGGFTPLYKAAKVGHNKITEILVTAGADINTRDDRGDTALHTAASNDHHSTIQFLVEAGADINIKNKMGITPFFLTNRKVKSSMQKINQQRTVFEAMLPRLADAQEFQILLSKGSYKSYNNRLYLGGACNVGKTTLASNLIGEDISMYWISTDGLKIYFGRNGIDLKTGKMVSLTEGNPYTILSTVLLGEPSLEQIPVPVKKIGVLGKIQNLFKRRKDKPVLTSSSELECSAGMSTDECSLTQMPLTQVFGESTKQLHVEDERISSDPLMRDPKLSLKGDTSDITILKEEIGVGMADGIRKGTYRIQIAPSDLVDFGGQKVYDLTHQLFIQQKGAFLLLLDGRKSLDQKLDEYQNVQMTTRDIILHWVNSILTYCSADDDDIYPLIAFAATHRDEFSKSEQKQRKKEISKQLTEMFRKHELSRRIKYEKLFFINATDKEDPGVTSLKEYLVSVAFQQKSWGEKMPMAWVPLEMKMVKMRSSGSFIISFDELYDLNKNNDDLSLADKQLKHFLRCQHSLGKIMYFDIRRLDQFIIVQPTAMVDILRSFITDEIFWPEEPSLNSVLSNASNRGIIKKCDLFKLWSQDEFDQYIPTNEKKEFIAHVLVHLDILVEPKRFHKAEMGLTESFIVPCMIRRHFPSQEFPSSTDDDRTIFLSYKFLKSAIPNALVYKLIGAILNIWPLKKKDEMGCLFDKAAVLEIDQSLELYLTFKKNRLIVALSNVQSKHYISPDVTSIIQECLTFTMTKVLEFYCTSFGKSDSMIDVSTLFKTEVGEKCGEEICFTSVSDIEGKPSWECEHNKEHKTKFPLYWIFDQKLEMCSRDCPGLDTQCLDMVPEDKHLIRLAKLIGREFNQFVIYLGLTKAEWDDIEENKNYNDRLTQKFIGMLEWKIHKQGRTFRDLAKALSNIGYSDHFLCQVFRDKLTEAYVIDNSRLQEIPDDDVLEELSRNIGNHTLQLGIELDVDLISIEETVVRYYKDMFAQKFDILMKWKATCKGQPIVRSLMMALQYVDLRAFRFLQEKYETKT